VRASVGVNHKTLENLQSRQRRFPTRLAASGPLCLEFSMFYESGLKHTPGGPFLHTFLDKQKSMMKILFV